MRIGIVAGEASGDLLGAGLIRAVKARCPEAVFEGIAGPEMEAAGCRALWPADKLSVMGLVEVLGHLPELLRIRRRLVERFLADPPDLFIGIDAPDFNLGLERRLKATGIRTVHYVSPSVWAWRRKRVRRIAESVDLMLTLFPFEAAFYREQRVPVRFVGHPLADMIPPEPDTAAARESLGLAPGAPLVALLPGSRGGEVGRLVGPFIDTAAWLWQRRPELRFVLPVARPGLRPAVEAAWRERAPDLPLTLVEGRSREAMAAADAVLLASGTATLEALLLKKPMAVAYRLAPLSYWLVRRLLKVPYYSLPNNLAGEALVEEFTQEAVRAETLGPALLALVDGDEARRRLQERFTAIHRELRRDASARAAEAVLELAA